MLAKLGGRSPEVKKRIEEYLSKIVPGVTGVKRRPVGPYETLEFRQAVQRSQQPSRFFAGNMSDGTLRAFGVLLALFQTAGSREQHRRLIGIEEPETALHPAAAAMLSDSLHDAAEQAQILVTSHSPEMLDSKEIAAESIFMVVSQDGESLIAPPDDASRAALQKNLWTAGELLRTEQLVADRMPARPSRKHTALFGAES